MNDKFYAFKKLIMDIIDELAPCKKIRLKKNNLPWIDGEVKELFLARDKLHALALEHSDRTHPIWKTFIEYRNRCKSLLRRKMIEFYADKTSSKFNSSKNFWTFYKSVVKTKKHASTTPSNIIDATTNESHSSSHAIAEVFNRHFTNIRIDSMINDDDSNFFVNETFRKLKLDRNIQCPSFTFKEITALDVIEAIKLLDSSSSSGITLIPVKVIKYSAETLAPVLAKLFNQFIKSGQIPDDLKYAIVFPLFKKGNQTVCDNYRGISILSPFAKIFERIISKQITSHFDENKLFCNQQHGFRQNHSCETALQTILDHWFKARADKEFVLALFIDFKKAFDLVDPHLLFLKLFHYGFDNQALNLLKNYFSSRYQSTKVDSKFSSKSPIFCGVPQGSILGPLLFIIFINDLIFNLDPTLFSILFADDTTIYATDRNLDRLIATFKKRFDPILDWIKYNKMSLNWSKTKFMVISPEQHAKVDILNQTIGYEPHIIIDGAQVEVVSQFKLLGCTLDEDLSFIPYISLLKQTILSKLFAIKNVFFLSHSVRLQFFKTFILPHFDYCASLFIYFNNTIINKLESLYNRCLSILLNININDKSFQEQHSFLKSFNLMPFKFRLFYRFSLFTHKILNNHILHNIFSLLTPTSKATHNLRDSSRNIFQESKVATKDGSKRISYILALFVNKVLRHSFNLNSKDFKLFVLENSFSKVNLFSKFSSIFSF